MNISQRNRLSFNSQEAREVQPGSSKLERDSPNIYPLDIRRSDLHLLLARTYLTRCGVLQNIICGVDTIARSRYEREDEREQRRSRRNHDYEVMHALALCAHTVATDEKDLELEIRSNYWLGRSCGSNHDYKAAMKHFQAAKNLDTISDASFDGTVPWRPNPAPKERSDIAELIEYCKKRLEMRAKRNAKPRKRASKDMEKQDILSDVNMVRDSDRSPVWAFDHERNLELVKQWQKESKGSDSNPQVPRLDSQGREVVSKIPETIFGVPEPIPEAQQPIGLTPTTITWDLPLRTAQGSGGSIVKTRVTASGNASPEDERDGRESGDAPPLGRKPTLSLRQAPRTTSSLSRRPTLSRRGTRGSYRSIRTMSSAVSSPRGQGLDVELGGDWEDIHTDSEEEDIPTDSEVEDVHTWH